MFKKYLVLPIIMFISLTVKQLIFNSEIAWIDNIGLSVTFYLLYVFWEWAKKPYDWNKSRKEI